MRQPIFSKNKYYLKAFKVISILFILIIFVISIDTILQIREKPEIVKLKWIKVENTNLRINKTTDGWLVYEHGCNITYVPDTDHSWIENK